MGQMGKGTKEMRSGHARLKLNRKTHMSEPLSSPTRSIVSVYNANSYLRYNMILLN